MKKLYYYLSRVLDINSSQWEYILHALESLH